MSQTVDTLILWVSVFADTYTSMYLHAFESDVTFGATFFGDMLFWLCQLI